MLAIIWQQKVATDFQFIKNTISTFAFSLLQYVVLVEVCREDCASLRFVVEKEKSLFRKLWIVFFDTTPKLNKCKFLKKFSCDVESETILELLVPGYIKIHSSILNFKWNFYLHVILEYDVLVIH